MSQTYKAIGINLKGMPLGEADRLVTVLTPQFGIIRAVAPGARKHKSRLRGRVELFVINELLIVKGKNLDKIIQAETIASFPGLSLHLGKLAASQYLAEISLGLALSEQPQQELYSILKEHLERLEQISTKSITQSLILAHLSQAIFHLLAVAGIAPQIHGCCVTQKSISPDTENLYQSQAGFSFEAGGIVSLATPPATTKPSQTQPQVNAQLNGVELGILQELAATQPLPTGTDIAWSRIERLLRDYLQYQLGKPIRAATLLDSLASF